ncbi:exodeoxyribonuclease VII large subunit [Nocardioides sp.]|uniref:exodeoxyribonuclease VII large subunit n=1 Tax=Nocardioides sp. TaxID=35761 RepID=UPI002B931F2E|nr:exodeoxyribonuclease VII large subunit [Nocardioides sp.]HXH81103.1 exodeoxyribonuclease VII large subunit [Nocardioides sp.]
MSEQQDPDHLFAEKLLQFQPQDDGVGGMSFIGEVVGVSPQARRHALFATLVISKGKTTGDVITAKIPYRVARFAKPRHQSGSGWVKVGQVLKLAGRLGQRDGQPFLDTRFLTWVEEFGPYERGRRKNAELLTGDPDYEKNSFEYADKLQIAEHPGSLNSIVLITSRGTKGQQDFTGRINLDCSPEQRISVKYRDVPVQGPRMVEEICGVLYGLTPDQGDIAVIVRGGGSWSDLRGFDDLLLAEAIRDCSIPVATAIGHRSDQHLADMVANFAFAVPGEAAVALQEGKKIAAERARERRHEVQRDRAAPPFTNEAVQPARPSARNTEARGTPPAAPKPFAPVPASWPAPPPMRPSSPRWWSRPFDKVSLCALIASLTCLGPVALALGLSGCYRTRGHRRRGRWAAVTATLLGGVVTIAMLAAGYAFVNDARVQPGACVGTIGSWQQVVESTVDCDQIHRGEVVYRGDVDPATLRSIRRGSQADRCLQQISQTTRKVLKRSSLTLRIVLTGEASLDEEFVCIVSSPRPVRGSLSERAKQD